MTSDGRAARETQEKDLAALGRELQDVIPAERWSAFDEDARARAIERATEVARLRMEIDRPVVVVWESDPDERGYEETTGELKLPRADLEEIAAEDAVGLVAHEMRHAWQWEVVQGRIVPPGGSLERERLTEAYKAYCPCDAFKYRNNELEVDAKDRAAHVVEAYVRDGGG